MIRIEWSPVIFSVKYYMAVNFSFKMCVTMIMRIDPSTLL